MTSLPGVMPLLDYDPAQIGPYRLIGRLGAGGMGVVYAALSAAGERVAVKVVHPELAHDPEFRARFAREIALLRKIRGACTVKVLSADANAPRPWLATEYVPGPTLDAHVHAAGPLVDDELYGLASGLAEALASIDAAGVVHRDLKPANVILSPSGPRVVDLGIARAVDETRVTRTGVLIGSPAWLSPENYRDDEVGPATDVHAWGLLIAFAATGRLPFGSGRPEVLAIRVMQQEVDLTGLDPDLRVIVADALAKAPENRPSAPEVLASVTAAWRRRTDVETGDLPETDAATVLIERTWVMPGVEDLPWVPMTSDAPPRPKRLRRRPILVLSGMAVIAAAAVIAGLLPALGTPSRHGAQTTKVSGSPSVGTVTSAVKTPSSAAAPTAEPPLRGTRLDSDAGVSVVIPAGWSASSGQGLMGPSLCIYMPHSGKNSSCQSKGVSIERWSNSNDEPNLDDSEAWVGGEDAGSLPQCFRINGQYIAGINTKVTLRNGLRKLGDRSAVYYEYHAECETGFTFNPRIWWLPKTRLMMTVAALPDRYRKTVDKIAASVHFYE
ncbi:MAG: serine/threonine protein kinase [Actinoallomurus sp.]